MRVRCRDLDSAPFSSVVLEFELGQECSRDLA